jgi:hypothetical protein
MASRGQLIAVAVDLDRTIHTRVAFYARGNAGGGLRAESVSVRLCVALQGIPAPAASAELLDTPCPSGRLPSGRYLEKADETVTLTH